jgi:putative MFS transporter
MSQSVFFIGSLIGAWVWGTVADKIGRRKVFFITLALAIISGFGYGLSPGYAIFVFFRLLSAISGAGLILSSYVLSVEIVGISARSYAGIAGAGFFSFAYPLLALLAYFIHSWRWLSVVISLLGLGYFPLWR